MGIGINAKWIVIYLLMLFSLYLLGVLVYRFIRRPAQLIGRFLLNAMMGFALLSLLKYFGSSLGLNMYANLFNVGFIGAFGLIGACSLVLLRFML